MRKIFRLLLYARPYTPRMVVSFVCVIGIALSNLIFPQIIGFLTDYVLNPRHAGATISALDLRWVMTKRQALNLIIVGVIAICIGRGLLTFLRSYLMSWVGQRVLFDLRNQIFQRLQELPMRFYDTRGTGQIMA